jgi:hypothetical protein
MCTRDIVEPVMLFLAAASAATAAFVTYRAADAGKKAARGATLLDCLNKYTTTMKHKREATQKRSVELAEEFYRELFDLHWTEFHIWQQGVIPDQIMRSWLYIRKRNFDTDSIPCVSPAGNTLAVTYRDQWQKVKRENYFEMSDPFVKFMDDAHAGPIADMKKLRKDTSKRRGQ